MIEITYWGHACIQLSDGETTLIFDPFISHNPMATIKPNQVKCDYILVSHGH
ncbi:MAG: MBL fold metallo-hydrolase, partial [Selenomonadales bacterium]|nr:MBL fold metallo-hydrolase [Selenomonadales bacterium]